MSAAPLVPAGGGGAPGSGWRIRGDVAIADVAIEAWGETLAGLFAAAAEATVATMAAEPDAIAARERRTVRLEERDADLLLYRFLEELVYFKDAQGLLLRAAKVEVRGDGPFALEAELAGEPLDPDRHRLQVDVKAVTLHGLRVGRTERGWEAFFVLDV